MRRFDTATAIDTDTEPARITPAQIRDSHLELGRALAEWRKTAGLTQRELALLLLYSRSGIANVETGRQTTTRDFWLRADRQLDADGLLIKAAEHVAELKRAYAAQAVRDRRRNERTSAPCDAGWAGCVCVQVVARWTGRETRALRVALRLGVPAFSRLLNVAPATAAAWEHPSPTTPSFAAQSALDRALRRSDGEVHARFQLLLQRRPPRTAEVLHVRRVRVLVGRKAMQVNGFAVARPMSSVNPPQGKGGDR